MKRIIAFNISLICFITVAAQDETLLNPNQSLIRTNPSFAGSNGSARAQLLYVQPWPNLPNNNFIGYSSVDAYVKEIHGGLAISGMYNNMLDGAFRSSQLNLIYAPVFDYRRGEVKIIPSVQLSYLQAKADGVWFAGTPTGFYSAPATPPKPVVKSNFDISVGLLVNYKNFYAGASVFHITRPDLGLYSSSNLPARISLNASYNLPINRRTLIYFSVQYNYQNYFSATMFTTNMIFCNHLLVGIGYLNADAAYINLGYRGKNFSVTGGFDLTVSKLAPNHRGNCQLALGLRLPKKELLAVPENFEKW